MDLEWNQATFGVASNPELPFEIVEIGAVKLSDDLQMVDEFSRLIRPQVYTRMHSITGKLIHLQMQELMSGDPFPEVYRDFRAWCGEEPRFCTWGPADLTELQRNMRYFDLPDLSSAPIAYLDIQKLFAIAFDHVEKQRRNLEYAVDQLGIDKDIPFHRAFSDAYYTARIMSRLPSEVFTRCSYDVFHLPKDRSREIHIIFDKIGESESYFKYISRAFESREKALADRDVMSTRCYLCDSWCKRRVKWFTTNERHYLAVSECPEHGLMKSKARIRKNENGRIYVDKTQKFISVREMQSLKRKREHMLYERERTENKSR